MMPPYFCINKSGLNKSNQQKKTSMKKKQPINNSKLHLAKEKIAVLNKRQAADIRAGKDAPDVTQRSTNYDFTCTWCTTILPPQDQL
jgi:hypothetical protein